MDFEIDGKKLKFIEFNTIVEKKLTTVFSYAGLMGYTIYIDTNDRLLLCHFLENGLSPSREINVLKALRILMPLNKDNTFNFIQATYPGKMETVFANDEIRIVGILNKIIEFLN